MAESETKPWETKMVTKKKTPKFDLAATRQFLEGLAPREVSDVEN